MKLLVQSVCDAAKRIAAARRSKVDYRTIDVIDPALQPGAPKIRKLTPEDT